MSDLHILIKPVAFHDGPEYLIHTRSMTLTGVRDSFAYLMRSRQASTRRFSDKSFHCCLATASWVACLEKGAPPPRHVDRVRPTDAKVNYVYHLYRPALTEAEERCSPSENHTGEYVLCERV